MSEKDKRRHPRAQVNRPGRIRVAGGPETNMQLIDVSEAGAAFFYSMRLLSGTVVELQFYLTIGERKALFVVQGQVRHYFVRGESHVIGIEFVKFITGAATTIREFVQHKTANDASKEESGTAQSRDQLG